MNEDWVLAPREPMVANAVRSVAPVCPYCGLGKAGWLAQDLQRGRRDVACGVEYHCYAGYCMD